MCIQFRIDGAQNFSRMSMCIEFVIDVLKPKNANLLLLGWYSLRDTREPGLTIRTPSPQPTEWRAAKGGTIGSED